jgi:hypothetical protein
MNEGQSWKSLSSGTWRHVVWYKSTKAFIIIIIIIIIIIVIVIINCNWVVTLWQQFLHQYRQLLFCGSSPYTSTDKTNKNKYT